MCAEKQIVYADRVRLGNWYEDTVLKESRLNKFLEQMKRGDLMLARFRTMNANLMKPVTLTKSTGQIEFGGLISILAPHVPSTEPPVEGKNGLLLGGRITSTEIAYSQDLEDGSTMAFFPQLQPMARNAFVITSADYCNREGETLKYSQEFLLTLASSKDKKPLYLRYDPIPVPGLTSTFPLYLSHNYVSNTRWRVLPIQRNDITRFEQEGLPVPVNSDIIINHCATNINLGVNVGVWSLGFHANICAPKMKTCLDKYGVETPDNVLQIYLPIDDGIEQK